jgi:hypothetical protein
MGADPDRIRFDRRMEMPPDRRPLGQNRPTGWRQSQQSGAPVRQIGRRLDEATTLQRLEIGSQGRPVHRQQRRHAAEVRWFRPIEHMRTENCPLVIPTGFSTTSKRRASVCAALCVCRHRQAFTHHKGGFEGKVGRSVHLKA